MLEAGVVPERDWIAVPEVDGCLTVLEGEPVLKGEKGERSRLLVYPVVLDE